MSYEERMKVLEGAVGLLYTVFFPSLAPKIVMERMRAHGLHSHLLEIANPKAEGYTGQKYGDALDEFEGDLYHILERAHNTFREAR